MISTNEARMLVAAVLPQPVPAPAAISDLRFVIAREAIIADRPFPPFDRVTMDGIAIDWSSYQLGNRHFKIQGCQSAGQAPLSLIDPHACIEVMTGAVLPVGCDTVIRYEDLSIFSEGEARTAEVKTTNPITPLQNVHRRGSDCPAGTELVDAGQPMLPPHWGVAAAVGKTELVASRIPRVAVLATGDELVPVSRTPLPHQIRTSNIYAVSSALKLFGVKFVTQAHVGDQPRAIQDRLAELLASHDILITLGGVSKGKFDHLPSALADCKVRKIFHEVRQRPGKPLWFGVGEAGQPVFGLPGNPVSVLVNLYAHVFPSLRQMIGQSEKISYARVSSNIGSDQAMTLFQPAKFHQDEQAVTWATPVRHNGSGDFAALAATDGFIELPAKHDASPAIPVFRAYQWNQP